MRCRYPGCKNRSKGPRFRFLCEEHLKLPKKKQDAALAKWAEKNSGSHYQPEAAAYRNRRMLHTPSETLRGAG